MQSLLLILAVSLLFQGIIIKTKSLLTGRKGPGLFQPTRDIVRLLRKGVVVSETTTLLFQISASIYFASVLTAILCVPFNGHPGLISFKGDFIFFAYILSFGKLLMVIAALDTGSSFEGMGASREAHFSMLAEPAFFATMGSMSLLTGQTSFHDIFFAFHLGSSFSYAIGFMIACIFLVLSLIENSRIPLDDPATHLELTMVHEVMVLDHSGFDLGLIQITTGLKFAMFGALITNLLNYSLSPVSSIFLFFTIQFVYAVSVGIIETFFARFRMGSNPQFIFTLTSFGILLFLFVLFIAGEFK